jgi:hypothetical protein
MNRLKAMVKSWLHKKGLIHSPSLTFILAYRGEN